MILAPESFVIKLLSKKNLWNFHFFVVQIVQYLPSNLLPVGVLHPSTCLLVVCSIALYSLIRLEFVGISYSIPIYSDLKFLFYLSLKTDLQWGLSQIPYCWKIRYYSPSLHIYWSVCTCSLICFPVTGFILLKVGTLVSYTTPLSLVNNAYLRPFGKMETLSV
jgi:hypothetical protein